MARVYRRPAARDDLLDIWLYIARDNPPRADSFLDELDALMSRLADEPLLGPARYDLGDGIRYMPHGRYLIFYPQRKDGIEIIRVLHGARRVEDLF
jgi:toxin ParE1/3/4